jgi:DNA-binding response OmpR family regulator
VVPAGEAAPRTILVIDDDPGVRALVRMALTADGFEVEVADNLQEAGARMAQPGIDLAVLDIKFADGDGRDFLTEVRRTSDIPIVLLSGLGSDSDKIMGLTLGADDYITKPFSPQELAVRVRTVLRRSTAAPVKSSGVLTFDRLRIDQKTREVTVDGAVVSLTAKEFDLLAFLASSPRQVFNRDQLLDHVWQSRSEWQDPATVTEYVRRLRKKIETDPDNPRWIETVRGVGYRFEP